jgi:hypothetical protein
MKTTTKRRLPETWSSSYREIEKLKPVKYMVIETLRLMQQSIRSLQASLITPYPSV